MATEQTMPYAARILSRKSRAEHVIDNSTWCVVAVITLALIVGDNLNGYLLQHRRLRPAL